MATIQGVYVALFGRPADPTGLAFFNSVTNNGANLSAIGNLASTAEYTARFTGMNNIQIINSIYQSLFGRDADATGLTFFANQLASGRQTINTIAINILDGATGSDLTTVNNKIAAANLYTASLDTGSEIVAYSGTAAADAGRAFIAGVTTTVPTQAAVDLAVANMVANKAADATFTLTTGTDNFGGTNGADVFVATQTTLQAADTLNGSAGIDKLNYTDTSSADSTIAVATVSAIEQINVSAKGGVAAVTGVSEKATVTFDALTATQGYTVAGRTLTAVNSLTAAEVAQFFATGSITGKTLNTDYTVTGTLTGYSASSTGLPAGQVLFTSNVSGNVTDLTVTAVATTEKATVTFAGLNATQSFTVAGVTLTAAAGNTLTAGEVAEFFATGSITGKTAGTEFTTSGTITGYTAAAGNTNQVVYTSATAGTNVTNLTVTGTGTGTSVTVAEGGLSPVSAVSIVQGVAATSATTANVTLDGSKFTGATEFASVDSTNNVTVSNVSATQAVSLKNGSANTGITFAAATDVTAATVNLEGVSGAGRFVTQTASGVTTATINSNGSSANGSSTNAVAINLSGNASVTKVNVNAAANLTATLTDGHFAAAGADLVVAGAAASVNLGTGGIFKTIDASGLTAGGITITTDSVTSSVKGGAGADVVTLDGLTSTATIDLGAGNDALRGTTVPGAGVTINGGAGTDSVASTLINAGNGAKFVGFEVLELGASTLDTALLTGSTLQKLALVGANAGNGTFTNVAAGVGLEVSSTSVAGGTSIGVKDAATNTTDSFAITFAGAAVTTVPTSANVVAGTLTLNGIETVSIASAGGANTWNSVTLTDDKLQVVNITGAQNLDLAFTGTNGTNTAANAGGAVKTIDGSAATGKLTIDTTNVTADDKAGVGLTVKTGSGADSITLAQKATVDAGAGNDTIVLSAAGGTVTTGAGSDTINVKDVVGSTNMATITDFVVGTDKLVLLNKGAEAFTSTKVDVSAASNLTAALNLAAAGNGGTDAQIKWFNYGGDTYVVQDNSNSTSFQNADIVVKLTGTLDLSSLTVAGFDFA
ncbi:DUF4214 domain-containing protein [Rhizobium sp. FKY42]|uniref:beta strand repeat-containing protein n=1 Tax=Rhizobium sp. FKY42 TaxID=2562310 RepID=UPI0010C12839|nr:DUF4214 domain-containing protein [Rhizobium sp. FKY42]